MIKKVFFFLIFSFSITVSSQQWNQNIEQTKINFTIKNFGVNVDGIFSDIKINTNFDVKNLSGSYIIAEIIVKSISTGIESRDEHILEEAYFDESNYKSILLKSTKLKKNEKGDIMMLADLTIKGTTKQLEIPLEISESKNNLSIKSGFIINRKDFKVGGGSFIMSKNVKIKVAYTGTK